MSREPGTADRPGYGGIIAAWMALALLYLALAGRAGWPDVALAILSGGATAALLRWVGRASERQFRHHPEWLLLSWRVVLHIARDCGVVARTLLRSMRQWRTVSGEFRELPWTPPDDPREAASLRALIAIGVSTAPNSYVVDIAQGPEGRVVLHHLVPPVEAEEPDEIWLP